MRYAFDAEKNIKPTGIVIDQQVRDVVSVGLKDINKVPTNEVRRKYCHKDLTYIKRQTFIAVLVLAHLPVSSSLRSSERRT